MLLARLGAAPVDPVTSVLVDAAVEVWRRPGFDSFLSLPQLSFVPFGYQMQTAQTVLRRMRGRAILADEVGLGKTIEAGLVLSELRMRGLADRTLVLTPAGLVEQWREELERKFGLPTDRPGSGLGGGGRGAAGGARLDRRRAPGAAQIPADRRAVGCGGGGRGAPVAQSAQRLGEARALRARYLLLLTATPVENRLQDLYELVSLVAPGLLGTPAQFRQRHAGAGTDPSAPRNLDALRARTREVMVRHRRSEAEVLLPQRLAETVLVAPSQEEAELYAGNAARTADPQTLQKRAFTFWEHAAGGDRRKLERLWAPDSPVAALLRLYGAAGPLYGIGVGSRERVESCSAAVFPAEGRRGWDGAGGEVHTDRGHHGFLLRWSLGPDRLIVEVLPHRTPFVMNASTMMARYRSGGTEPATRLPRTGAELDPVAHLLWQRTPARYGAHLAARALASWWRLAAPQALRERYPAAVLAAAAERSACYWSGVGGGGYGDAPLLWQVPEADLRKAGTHLQRLLKPTQDQPW